MFRVDLVEGHLVHINSRHDSWLLPVAASEQLAMMQTFIAIRRGEKFVSDYTGSGERMGGLNALPTSAFCPSTKQSGLKHAAVKIVKAKMPWRLPGAVRLPSDASLLT